MKTALIVAVLIAATLPGCATNKTWSAMSGSKADGTVKLGYEYGGFEKPVVSQEQGRSLAQMRCSAWGYTDAEPFGAVVQHCTQANAYGCTNWIVTTEYQCTGNK